MLDGRVKTLHPRVHGGILAIRDNPQHQATLKEHNIEPIDLVVCNLYPFEATVAKPGSSARGDHREHRHRRPVDGAVGEQELSRRRRRHRSGAVRARSPRRLKANSGALDLPTRERLAGAAFARTAAYDAAIAGYFAQDAKRATMCAGRGSTSALSAQAEACATARTRTSRPRSTSSRTSSMPASRRPRCCTARSCRTTTSSTSTAP